MLCCQTPERMTLSGLRHSNGSISLQVYKLKLLKRDQTRAGTILFFYQWQQPTMFMSAIFLRFLADPAQFC
jgi:hypothetical protein